MSSRELQRIEEVMRPEDLAIHINGLTKTFKLYSKPSELLRELLTGRHYHDEFHALRDISLDVRHGEVVGILGRNGAGKSTLLKIVAGVLDHDAGEILVNGRVAALLELGTGFSPEYSGRNNILFGGMCLGMKKDEVLAKMDSIIDFAELRGVIDQPFKTYSTGMKARLTFATAISVDADILIIDEALAVGDALFAEKCFKRIKEIAASGKTIFFVTHTLGQIYELCDRAILLDHGKLVCDGLPRYVGHEYEALLARDRNKSAGKSMQETVLSRGKDKPEQAEAMDAYVSQMRLLDEHGNETATIYHGEDYQILIEVRFNKDIAKAGVSFRMETPSGIVVFGDSTAFHEVDISGTAGRSARYAFGFRNVLAPGEYLLGGGVVEVMGEGFNVLHIIRGDALITATGRPVTGFVDLGCRFDVLQD